MMSIDNTYDESEVREFDRRVKKGLGSEEPRYVLEPKVDGVAATVRYERGILILAATRVQHISLEETLLGVAFFDGGRQLAISAGHTNRVLLYSIRDGRAAFPLPRSVATASACVSTSCLPTALA